MTDLIIALAVGLPIIIFLCAVVTRIFLDHAEALAEHAQTPRRVDVHVYHHTAPPPTIIDVPRLPQSRAVAYPVAASRPQAMERR